MNGGEHVAEVLSRQGVRFLFTLCGGHISPILSGAKKRGIRVVDTRHEVNAAFAADAVSRLTGVPGVAAVTAGPGVTNTITALKNAQLAQSPLVILVGAAATVLRGRGSLQDIDQASLLTPHVKRFFAVKRVRDLAPSVEEAFRVAVEGVPGPVAVECPIDLLYDESLVRDWYVKGGKAKSFMEAAQNTYLKAHLTQLFFGSGAPRITGKPLPTAPEPSTLSVMQAGLRLGRAKKPVMLVGSQTLLEPGAVTELQRAIEKLGVPVYLSGMGRGLMGDKHPLQLRHKRREALRESDLVILSGVPCDFRLDYGRHIKASTPVISINRSDEDRSKNRRPTQGVDADPGRFLRALAERSGNGGGVWASWIETLKKRDAEREVEIDKMAAEKIEGINPVALCRRIEAAMDPKAVIIADGGDFVGTAAYTLNPRGPLTWLDPGVFGTLGVGAGFAMGAALCRPDHETWIIYGDGSLGYSLAEFDTYRRHKLPIIAVVGNDGSWQQIARDQIEILKDDVGTVLRQTDYHIAAEGLGGKGLLLDDPAKIDAVLAEAKALAKQGHAVLVNAMIGKTEFRKGSISM